MALGRCFAGPKPHKAMFIWTSPERKPFQKYEDKEGVSPAK